MKTIETCLKNSEKVSWKISDLLPDDFIINFDKNFVPDNLCHINQFSFLSDSSKKDLNHIWAASYLNIFAFVEEYITLFTLNLASLARFSESHRLRALLRFSEEEVKHQILFRNYISKFNESFKTPCSLLTGEKEAASVILSNSKEAVIVLTYHLEIITQAHYLESISKAEDLDQKFKDILKFHWMEEVQHAQLDLLELKDIFKKSNDDEINTAISEYFNIIDIFLTLLKNQAQMNLESLKACLLSDNEGAISEENEKEIVKGQWESYRDAFILSGLTNETLLGELDKISPVFRKRFEEKTSAILNQTVENF